MTHRGGLSFSIIIWRIGGGGGKFLFALGPNNSRGVPDHNEREINETTETALSVSFNEIEVFIPVDGSLCYKRSGYIWS